LKILHINASYKPAYIYGGPTMSVSKLCEQLVVAGCEIEVFTTTANGNDELAVAPGKPVSVDGVTVTYFKRLTKDHTHYSPDLLKNLRKRVREFDAVHIHAWWNLVSVLACRIAINNQIPVIISPRGTLSLYSFGNKNSFVKRLIHDYLGERLLRKSAIHVTSDREKTAIENLVSTRSIFNIPNFIALPAVSLNSERSEGVQVKLIFFSRIEQKKGLEILLYALGKCSVDFRLTIAGDGEPDYLTNLKSLANKLGIAKNLNWVGFQGANKFDVLRQHDVMILPSYDENFGNVVIESLSVGTAVLLSENVGLANYVQENNLGWVVTNNAESFTDIIEKLPTEKLKLSRIRQQAPDIIRKDFLEETLGIQYLHMYQQIIHGNL